MCVMFDDVIVDFYVRWEMRFGEGKYVCGVRVVEGEFCGESEGRSDASYG